MKRLGEKQLTLKLLRCIFDQATVEYYRCSFLNEGMRAIFQKLAHSKKPSDLVMLQKFLGLAKFWKQIIDGYSTLTYLLRLLTHKDIRFKWEDKCEHLQHIYQCHCVLVTNHETNPIIMYVSPVLVSSILLQQSP